MSLDFLPPVFDVIIYDEVGMGFIGSNAAFTGMGGSEFEEVLLLEKLVKHGKAVLSLNNTIVAAYQNGVHYFPRDTIKFQKFKCKTLILQRMSQMPPNIEYEKILIWITDIPGDPYAVHAKWSNVANATFVCVSDWQRGLLPPNIENKITIYNMIPDAVYNTNVAKNFNKLVYTSAAMKGLNETIEAYKELRKSYFLKKTELLVLSPGYDQPNMELLEKNKISFGGSIPFTNVVTETATSAALFYVNRMPETFGISVVLAEIVGCAPFVLCLSDIGALKEVCNSPYITKDPKEFEKNLGEFIKNKNTYKVQPKDFRASKIIKDWLAVI